jgi:hypothetical protein
MASSLKLLRCFNVAANLRTSGASTAGLISRRRPLVFANSSTSSQNLYDEYWNFGSLLFHCAYLSFGTALNASFSLGTTLTAPLAPEVVLCATTLDHRNEQEAQIARPAFPRKQRHLVEVVGRDARFCRLGEIRADYEAPPQTRRGLRRRLNTWSASLASNETKMSDGHRDRAWAGANRF